MEKTDLEVRKNQKGKDTILYNKNRYNFSLKNKNGTSRWRCVNRHDCSSTITLNSSKNIVLRSTPHTCLQKKILNDIFIAVDDCKKKVCHNFGSVEKIFEKRFQKLKKNCKADDITHIPNFSSKKDCLYAARKSFLETKSLSFQTIADVHVPKGLGKDFLVCEEGTTEKIILFCSRTAQMFLKNEEENIAMYFGDGTFYCVPQHHYQLYSLHVDIGSNENVTNVVPVIFALLPNKSEQTYVRLFELIKNKLSVEMPTFKCDFETAVMKAVKRVFPNCKISGCFYHYNKAIWRTAKKFNLTLTSDSRKMVRMVSYLPLLPSRFIEDAWNSIIRETDDTEDIRKFKNYFNKQWIPLVRDEILNCAFERHRTTNPVEGWHRRLNARFQKKCPFFKFVFKLKREADYQDHKIMKSYFDVPKKNRRDRQIYADKKITQFVQDVETDIITPVQFLKKVIYFKLNH